MYDRVLERIDTTAPSNEVEVISFLLRWVLYAKEPLSFREVQSLYYFLEGDSYWDVQKLISTRCARLVYLVGASDNR